MQLDNLHNYGCFPWLLLHFQNSEQECYVCYLSKTFCEFLPDVIYSKPGLDLLLNDFIETQAQVDPCHIDRRPVSLRQPGPWSVDKFNPFL